MYIYIIHPINFMVGDPLYQIRTGHACVISSPPNPTSQSAQLQGMQGV